MFPYLLSLSRRLDYLPPGHCNGLVSKNICHTTTYKMDFWAGYGYGNPGVCDGDTSNLIGWGDTSNRLSPPNNTPPEQCLYEACFRISRRWTDINLDRYLLRDYRVITTSLFCRYYVITSDWSDLIGRQVFSPPGYPGVWKKLRKNLLNMSFLNIHLDGVLKIFATMSGRPSCKKKNYC